MASTHTYALVTGANSGLGLSICLRLIDDFLKTKPSSSRLTIIFTTRTSKKSADTLKTLQTRLSKHQTASASDRVHFRPEHVNLTELLSVRALAQRLVASDIPKLDAIILNAGIVGLTGLNWPLAIWSVTTDTVNALTWPTFKYAAVGLITPRQFPTIKGKEIEEPPLGEIFCANVFGHYMLAHWLMSLLRACDSSCPGRVIWVASIEGSSSEFDVDDIQGVRSAGSYIHSKRLTDLIALTARGQPSTSKSVQSFITPSPSDKSSRPLKSVPSIFVAHPGVCVTSIVPMPWILVQAFTLSAYLSRLLGSPWALVSSYLGAVAFTWLALASPFEIREKETHDPDGNGSVKWGSAVNRSGREHVGKTDVEGWGLNGSGQPFQHTWWAVDWLGPWGRRQGATDASTEEVEGFVEQGSRVWREMEELRVLWEAKIDEFDKMQS